MKKATLILMVAVVVGLFVVSFLLPYEQVKNWKEWSEPFLYMLQSPYTFLAVVVALVTLGALWRQFIEALGGQYYLTCIYKRKEDGAEYEARDLWESCEPLRVLKAGLASQQGLFVVGAATDYKLEKTSFFEYKLVVNVDDLTQRGKGSVFPDLPKKDKA